MEGDHGHGHSGQMDPSRMLESQEEEAGGVMDCVSRSLRRQKNILIFGSPREKVARVALVAYIVLVHFYAFEYYLG